MVGNACLYISSSLGPEEVLDWKNCHRIVKDGANPLQIISNYEERRRT